MNTKIKPKKISKTLWIAIVALVLIVISTAVILFTVFNSTNYVAKVGKQYISKADFDFYLMVTKMDMLSRKDPAFAALPANDLTQMAEKAKKVNEFDWVNTKTNGEADIELAKKDTLKALTQIKLQIDKAADNKIVLKDSDIKEIDNTIQQRFVQPSNNSKTEADKLIRDIYNVSLDDLKNIYKDYILMQNFKADYIKKYETKDPELKKIYEENKIDVDKAKVQHILILTQDSKKNDLTGDKLVAAKKKADNVLALAKSKKDFNSLVKTYTEDPGSKDTNGEYSFLANQRSLSNYESGTLDQNGSGVVTEFAKWAFDTKKLGDIGMVKTKFGYHIMHLLARNNTFEVADKELLKNGLRNKLYSEDLAKWEKDSKYSPDKNLQEYNAIK